MASVDLNSHLLKAHRNGRLTFHDLINEILPLRELPEFMWGSSQYQTAAQMYTFLYALRELFLDEAEHIRDDKMFEALKFNIVVGRERNYEDVVADLIEDGIFDQCISGATNFDELFIYLGKNGHDLWHVVNMIFQYTFPDNRINGVYPSNGNGPILNMICQSSNYTTGIKCYIMKLNGVIQTESSFYNFDT